MTQSNVAESKALSILMADALDIEAAIGVRHRARAYTAEREAILDAIGDIASSSLDQKEARLAAAHWALGETTKAMAHADKAGDSPLGRLVAGILKEEAKRHEEALADFQKAASLAPTSAPCVLSQLSVLRRLGRVDEALKLIDKLRREFSDKADFSYYEGRCLEDQGQYQEALECYRRAIDIKPDHPRSLFHAARLCDLRGIEAEARKFYERIGPAEPAPFVNACLNLALLNEDAGDYEGAARACRKVLQVQPQHKRARMILKDIEAAEDMYYSPEETKQSERLEAVLRVPVSDFELSVRSRNCLAKMNIVSLGDLVKKTESEMLAYKNFGETSLREIKEMLSSRGLRLGMLREDAATRAAMERKRQGANQELLDKSIHELELSVRSRKAMEKLGIRTVADLVEHSELELQSVKNFGRISLNEIKKRLTELGIGFKDSDLDE